MIYFIIYIFNNIQVLHGCRQSVFWDVMLIHLTDVIPNLFNKYKNIVNLLMNINSKGSKSNHYGLNNLGYTRTTKIITIWYEIVRLSKTNKNLSKFRLFSVSREYEGGIASNHKIECYGEYIPDLCTHRPSRHGIWYIWKNNYYLSIFNIFIIIDNLIINIKEINIIIHLIFILETGVKP